MVRAMSASRFAFRYAEQVTKAPISTRSVASAQAASIDHASKCRPSGSPLRGKKWSQLKRTSTPMSSSVAQPADVGVVGVLRLDLDGDAGGGAGIPHPRHSPWSAAPGLGPRTDGQPP